MKGAEHSAPSGREGESPTIGAQAKILHQRIDREVGARVKARRKALKLSQTRLGEQIGVTFQQVQKYERGANRISASALVAIAAALNTTAAALLQGLGPDAEGPSAISWAAGPEGARAFDALHQLRPDAFDAVLATARAVAALTIQGRAA